MKRVLSWSLILVSVAGCDWLHTSLVNTIPYQGKKRGGEPFYVYLGIDGLSHSTVKEAVEHGHFKEPQWKLSKFVTMFPGTSDASWTRILHTEPLEGYEYTYFDPKKDAIINKGYLGLLKHVVPTIVDGMSLEAPYLKAFDYRGNGYMHSIGAYHDIDANFGESLDNLFFLLEGRIATTDAFFGYMLEIDAMGHILEQNEVQKAFESLAKRIEKFKALHPERKFYFTLFSDHAVDFVKVNPSNLMFLSEEMKKIGVDPVEHLNGQRPEKDEAVAIDHVRLTYLSLHARFPKVESVARQVSTLSFVDCTVGKLSAEAAAVYPNRTDIEWYGVWENARRALVFGFDPTTDEYLIPNGQDLARFDISIARRTDPNPRYSDEFLFTATKDGKYPDLFYRIRTGLSAVGVKYPADVLVSLRPSYAAIGFKLPWGDKEFSLAGFHGSLRDLGTNGTLLTDERDLPSSVRSDTLFELFPRLKNHIERKGIKLYPGDKNASLRY